MVCYNYDACSDFTTTILHFKNKLSKAKANKQPRITEIIEQNLCCVFNCFCMYLTYVLCQKKPEEWVDFVMISEVKQVFETTGYFNVTKLNTPQFVDLLEASRNK